MKGIILAGGMGTRLYPSTLSVCKQLLPVYDKPMIYYPLSVLMLANIRDILIISRKEDLSKYKKLFGNGNSLGIKISYIIQKKPRGLVDAFLIGNKFIGKENVCLILGDNIFYGDGLPKLLRDSINFVDIKKKSIVFSYKVSNPNSYGVIKEKNNKIISIIEKPKFTNSKEAVVGLYLYPNNVVELSKKIKPSKSRELEITDLNNLYLKEKKLELRKLGRGTAWFDTGSAENLFEASQLIRILEKRMGYKIGCPEEISLNKNWISKKKFLKIITKYNKSEYGKYLMEIIK
jgi:glucose-1-phosphate thymidylyltransferase